MDGYRNNGRGNGSDQDSGQKHGESQKETKTATGTAGGDRDSDGQRKRHADKWNQKGTKELRERTGRDTKTETKAGPAF